MKGEIYIQLYHENKGHVKQGLVIVAASAAVSFLAVGGSFKFSIFSFHTMWTSEDWLIHINHFFSSEILQKVSSYRSKERRYLCVNFK